MAISCNVGGADKTFRIVAGVVLAAVALLSDIDTPWKVLAGVLAAIALLTALIGYCPLNSLLGIDSCKHKA